MRIVESPNFDDRPPGTEVTLVVLHSISPPPGEYGGQAIEQLFTNCLDPGAHPYFREICALKVSSHYLVRRDGELIQFVAPQKRAIGSPMSFKCSAATKIRQRDRPVRRRQTS